MPTLSSNPISHLPSGGAEGLNFVVRGKVHIHILSRLSVKLSPTAHSCFPFCLVSHPWEHCPMPQPEELNQLQAGSCARDQGTQMGSFGQANRAGGWEKSMMVISLSHTLQSCFTVMKHTSSMLSHFLDLLLNWFGSQRGEGN